MISPQPLSAGDHIAILSPASIINPKLIEPALTTLREAGFIPVLYPHALDRHGSYAGDIESRLDDLTEALLDPSVRAIIATRGGYGAVHLLEKLSTLPLSNDPKWLVGFSDISALHALMASKGIMSIHASMVKQLAEGRDTLATRSLVEILKGNTPQTITFIPPEDSINRPGTVTAPVRGGNMAVLEGLAATQFDNWAPGSILFIEDVGEPIYKIERMLYRWKLSGIIDRAAAIVVGQFTDYSPSRDHSTMDAMISDMLSDSTIPIAYGAPIGHIGGQNLPIVHATYTLTVTPTSAHLQLASSLTKNG